jgi:FMN phosphatase YigB (HAD superfamily)
MKTILIDAVNTFVVDGKVDDAIYKLLESYKNNKIIVTNANDEQMIEFGLINLPYQLYTLKHNPDKTNPEYFKKFLAEFNPGANDVVYFEHNINAVKSAESVGITSFHFDDTERDMLELKLFLDINLKNNSTSPFGEVETSVHK